MQTSLWLLPERASAAKFQALINDFGRQFGGPGFAAHLTIVGQCCRLGPADIRAIAEQFVPLDLETAVLETGSAYFQSLYQTFYPAPGLIALRSAVLEFCARRPGSEVQTPPDAHAAPAPDLTKQNTKTYDPHLSLFYGRPDASQHAQMLCKSAEQLIGSQSGMPVRFDGLALVETADKNVNNWKVAEEYRLRQ